MVVAGLAVAVIAMPLAREVVLAAVAADLDETARLPRHAGGTAVVAALRERLGAIGVPAFVVDTAHPTTIGLGDTFVGGFLAAVPAAARTATGVALERALDAAATAP